MTTEPVRKLHSKIVDWAYFHDGECLQILIYLMAKVRLTNGQFLCNKIKRGEIVVGRGTIAAATGIGETAVRTRIKWFLESGEITMRKIKGNGRDYGVIMLTNFDQHQKDEEPKIKIQRQVQNSPLPQFKKPTIEEIDEYIRGRVADGRPEVCAETFCNFYESKGWRVGNQTMKSWKAAVHTWENKERKNEIISTLEK